MEIYFIAQPSIQSTFLSVPCVLEKEICVLMLLGEMFYKCRVGQTIIVQVLCILIFYLLVLSVNVKGGLISTIIVYFSIFYSVMLAFISCILILY